MSANWLCTLVVHNGTRCVTISYSLLSLDLPDQN